MPNQTQRAKPRQRLPKPYVAVWGMLASAAVAYLGVALVAPELIGVPGVSARMSSERVASGGATGNFERGLQERLSRAQLEIAKLRTELSKQKERQAVASRAAASRLRGAQVAVVAPAKRQEMPRVNPVVTTQILNRQSDKASAPAPASKPAPVVPVAKVATEPAAKVPAAPAAKVAVVPAAQPVNEIAVATAQIESARKNSTTQPAPSKIVTGSLKIPPPPTRAPPAPLQPARVIGAPKVPPSSTPAKKAGGVTTPVATAPATTITARLEEPSVGVRLATGPSVDVLRLRWTTMLERGGAAMSGLEPHFIASTKPGALGPTYDLIAGPLRTLSDAQRICNAAAVRNTVCEIRKLKGARTL